MSNEATLSPAEMILSKYASEVFAGLVAPLEGMEISPIAADEPLAKEDVLVRINHELQRALEKSPSERRWVMVIDLRRCIGCHACTVACVAENKLPLGVVYRPVMSEEIGTYPNVTMKFLPRPCMQCEKSPCTEVYPVTATYHDEEGIVVVNYEQCIGCRARMAACPYGARTFDFGYTYTEQLPVFDGAVFGGETAAGYEHASQEYGEAWKREGIHESPVGNVRKCHFCLPRVKRTRTGGFKNDGARSHERRDCRTTQFERKDRRDLSRTKNGKIGIEDTRGIGEICITRGFDQKGLKEGWKHISAPSGEIVQSYCSRYSITPISKSQVES